MLVATELLRKFLHVDKNIRQNDALIDQSTNMADDMSRTLRMSMFILILITVVLYSDPSSLPIIKVLPD